MPLEAQQLLAKTVILTAIFVFCDDFFVRQVIAIMKEKEENQGGFIFLGLLMIAICTSATIILGICTFQISILPI